MSRPTRRASDLATLIAGPLCLVFVVGLLWVCARAFPGDLAVSQGRGIAGVVTVEEVRCGKNPCQALGPWHSDDGSRTMPYVSVQVDRASPGDRVAAVATPDGRTVYRAGSHPVVFSLLGLAGFGAFGLVIVALIVDSLRRLLRRNP